MGRQDFSDRMKDSPWTLITVPNHDLVKPGVQKRSVRLKAHQ